MRNLRSSRRNLSLNGIHHTGEAGEILSVEQLVRKEQREEVGMDKARQAHLLVSEEEKEEEDMEKVSQVHQLVSVEVIIRHSSGRVHREEGIREVERNVRDFREAGDNKEVGRNVKEIKEIGDNREVVRNKEGIKEVGHSKRVCREVACNKGAGDSSVMVCKEEARLNRENQKEVAGNGETGNEPNLSRGPGKEEKLSRETGNEANLLGRQTGKEANPSRV